MAQDLLSLRRGVEQHLLRCIICFKSHKVPKILPCYHVACLSCLTSLVGEQTEFQCPDCGTKVDVPRQRVKGFKDFASLDQLAKLIEKQTLNKEPVLCVNHKQKHDGASGHKVATLKCIECNVNYCTICIEVHATIPVTANHQVIDIEDDSVSSPPTLPPRKARAQLSMQIMEISGLKSKPTIVQSVHAGGRVQYITLYNKRIVATTWDGETEHPNKIFMHPMTDPLAKRLQEMTKKTFSDPNSVACVYYNGKYRLAMTDTYGTEGIKLLGLQDGTIDDLAPARNHGARIIAVNANNTITYGDQRVPVSIKVVENMKTCKTVIQNTTDNEIFLQPMPCIDSKDNIIIVDVELHTVSKYDKNGKVLFTYSNFDVPWEDQYLIRVCVDNRDYIYASVTEQHIILCLDPEGQFKGYILTAEDGISEPIALHFEHPNLYVGQANGEIKVYKIY